MENLNDDVGPEAPPEDNEFNVDEEVDINSPVLLDKISH